MSFNCTCHSWPTLNSLNKHRTKKGWNVCDKKLSSGIHVKKVLDQIRKYVFVNRLVFCVLWTVFCNINVNLWWKVKKKKVFWVRWKMFRHFFLFNLEWKTLFRAFGIAWKVMAQQVDESKRKFLVKFFYSFYFMCV